MHSAVRKWRSWEPSFPTLDDINCGALLSLRLNQVEQGARVIRAKPDAAVRDQPADIAFDPIARRGLLIALGSSELAGIAETRRAREV